MRTAQAQCIYDLRMRQALARRPDVEGNRPAALTATEDQSMCRRVRLTVRLGVGDCDDSGFTFTDTLNWNRPFR